MLTLDGAELSFVFVFGFLGALWSRRVFAPPAVFLLLQYCVLWPLYILGTASNDVAPILIAYAVTVWCGSASGVCVGALLGSARLLHRREAGLRPTLTHLVLLLVSMCSTWAYVGLHAVFQPPWPSVAGACAVALTHIASWYVWKQPYMFAYFPSIHNVRWFVSASAGVQGIVLATFCAVDYAAVHVTDSAVVGFALRGISIATITLVLLITRFSSCYKRLSDQRELELRTPYHANPALFRANMLTDITTSSSEDDAKTDSDYVEYADP